MNKLGVWGASSFNRKKKKRMEKRGEYMCGLFHTNFVNRSSETINLG